MIRYVISVSRSRDATKSHGDKIRAQLEFSGPLHD